MKQVRNEASANYAKHLNYKAICKEYNSEIPHMLKA